MPVDAIAFDAFGTLFDLESLRPSMGDPLFESFTARLVPWTWHSAASHAFRPLPEIAADALKAAARAEDIELGGERLSGLVGEMRSLDPFPDVGPGLEALAGWQMAVLSNGTLDGVGALVDAAGLRGHFVHLLAADQAGRYKPSAEVYALATRAFRTRADRVLLVSSNEWDVAGAATFGMRTAWLARGRTPSWVLGVEPDYVVDAPGDLASALG